MKSTCILEKEMFKTEHLINNLKENSVKGAFFTISSQIIKFFLNMVYTVILARILTPSDFGLVAMVSVFTGFVALFVDLGLSMATVQNEKINKQQISNLFWVNLGVSILITIVSCSLSPLIVSFYGEPRLSLIMIAISCSFIFGGLSAQHIALLRRQMKFKHIAYIQISSMIVGIGAAIILAFLKAGYWALVFHTVAQSFASMLLSWVFLPWIPSFPKKETGLKAMLTFGRNLTIFNLLNYFSRNADNFIIGKWIGSGSLGIYTKAYNLLLLPIQQISAPFSSVAIPALSRVNSEPDRYRRVFVQFQSTIVLITLPIMFFLLIAAEKVILIVLGQQWKEAISVFRWLGLVGITQAALVSSGWVFVSQNRTKEMLQWGVVGSLLCLLSFIIGLPWGINGVAASYGLSGLIVRTPISFWWLTRKGHIKPRHYLITLLPSIKLSAILIICCSITNYFLPFANDILNLSILSLSAIISYSISYFLFEDIRESYNEIVKLFPSAFKAKGKKNQNQLSISMSKKSIKTSQSTNSTK